jgi:outer membrane assembly lipoprotein YfiO
MNRRFLLSVVVAVGVLSFPHICPAPIIFRPGEGWTYEPVGSEGKWTRNRAKDQLQVAKEAFERKDYRTSAKAARRVAKVWPLSDYAGEAVYYLGRCYEARGIDQQAFKQYQRVLTRYPKVKNYEEILQRQFDIATRFLGGQRFKLFGYIPFFPSMDKTAKYFEDVVKNGPYNETGPKAQMNIGAAREKKKEYGKAVEAYRQAVDRYHDRPDVASDALFKQGLAYNKQAKRAEYDQSVASQAIASFQDFRELYPKDKRIPESENLISSLKLEQARGAFQTAKFYEKSRRWQGAVVYYNEVLIHDKESPFAAEARERIARLQPKADAAAKKRADADKEWRERKRAAQERPTELAPATENK